MLFSQGPSAESKILFRQKKKFFRKKLSKFIKCFKLLLLLNILVFNEHGHGYQSRISHKVSNDIPMLSDP